MPQYLQDQTTGVKSKVRDDGSHPVSIVKSEPITDTLQEAVEANANGAALATEGYASVLFTVTGTFDATVTFQGSRDNTNWFNIQAQNMSDATQASAVTAAGLYSAGIGGLEYVRAVVSNYVSGAVTVDATALPLAMTPLTTATLNAVVDAVKVKDAAGVNGLAIDAAGAAKVSVSGSLVTDHTFHDAIVATADGTAFTVAGHKTLTVEIWGTSTSRTIEFKGAGLEGTYRPIMGVRLSDLSTAISTTGTGELWQFDITGLASVIMDCSAVAGGNLTVKGKAVA
jgi:hypothetical protein